MGRNERGVAGRGTQQLVLKLAGRETYQEYAPLIAGSLLRVRLEFCVLESFVYESIIPFVKVCLAIHSRERRTTSQNQLSE